MTAWPWLAGAILSEVSATLALRAATDRPAWSVLTAVGYTASFVFLAAVLRRGMAIGVAYGIWAASGVTLTALAAAVLFDEALTGVMGLGFVAIVAGVLLGAAIVSEVAGTMFLRASDGLRRKRWIPAITTAYVVSFGFLTLALARGMAVGVAYGVWAASGIALTAVIARVAFGEPLTRTMGAGIALVALGVLLVELGAASH